MVRRSTSVIPTGTIGRLQRSILAAPTACTSTVATSFQALAAATSTSGGWCVALHVIIISE